MNEKPFKCYINNCGQSFSKEYILMIHQMRINLNIKLTNVMNIIVTKVSSFCRNSKYIKILFIRQINRANNCLQILAKNIEIMKVEI